MIEAPEALILSEQLNKTIKGKKITFVSAEYTPHKFVWYYGDPSHYSDRLLNKTVSEAHAYGGLVDIEIEDTRLLFDDGMNLCYHTPGKKISENTDQYVIGRTERNALSLCKRYPSGNIPGRRT